MRAREATVGWVEASNIGLGAAHAEWKAAHTHPGKDLITFLTCRGHRVRVVVPVSLQVRFLDFELGAQRMVMTTLKVPLDQRAHVDCRLTVDCRRPCRCSWSRKVMLVNMNRRGNTAVGRDLNGASVCEYFEHVKCILQSP